MASLPSHVCPAGRQVTLFNDEAFRQLRRLAGVPDDFANEGWSFESLEPSGAKGGCLMGFIGSEYVIKELSYDDHQSLLEIAQSYAQHVTTGPTLLSAILLHFEDSESGRRFFAMRNAVGSGPFLAMYDLKGCNDDKTLELFGHKIVTVPMLLRSAGQICGQLEAAEWYAYNTGKWAAARADLVVTEAQRQEVVRLMRRDTAWLAQHRLMDYSLLVGMKTGKPGFAPTARLGQLALTRPCSDGSEVAVCVGIIDFLQRWNFKKVAARAVKCFECNKATIPPDAYARRFCLHFEERFVAAKAVEELLPARRRKEVGSPVKVLGVEEPEEKAALTH
uniref:PIPK domain-containing protein n=1 Tax=Alexandrium monilatum TaxID=311494 RepID=A0A6T0XCU5_9DINO